MESERLQYTLDEVKKIAREAGEYIRSERMKFNRSSVESKNPHDYVSYVDKTSEKMIVGKLHELLPEAGFITEEGTATRNEEKLFWVIDPLDGTTNFIHDNAPFCVSIALCSSSETLMGVVYECCRDELFWAVKGGKAYLNGKEIKVSSVADMNSAFIQLGFPYRSDDYNSIATKLVNRLYGNVGGLRLQGSAAAELCYIAAGRFEARVEAYLGAWDIAAGAFILKQAGGKTTDFSGNPIHIDAKEVLASNGLVHESMIEAMACCTDKI